MLRNNQVPDKDFTQVGIRGQFANENKFSQNG